MDRLKCIRTFIQIVRSGNMASAAAELNTSRSLVSTHLKQLESYLGVRLVNRTTRHVVLTAIGKEYYALCVDAWSALEAADTVVHRLQTAIEGPVKVMASAGYATTQLAPIMATFCEAHPDVRISFFLFDRAFTPDEFIGGGFDVGVSMHPIKDASLYSVRVGEVPWILCATDRYLRTHPPLEGPADLVHHACLVHRSHAPNSTWGFRRANKARIEQKVDGPMFANSSSVLKEALLRHVGMAFMPLYAVEKEIATKLLTPLLLEYEAERRPIFLVYPHLKQLPRRTRVLIDFMRKAVKERTVALNAILRLHTGGTQEASKKRA